MTGHSTHFDSKLDCQFVTGHSTHFDSKLDCQFVTGNSTHFQVGGDNPKVEEQEFF